MKYNYQNIAISKDFYKSGEDFSKCLERLDPSEQYRGTELAGYDAFQRQLKRFDIKVSGQDSDRLQKFFATSDSAALFPEYVARAVKQGVDGNHILEEICAAQTQIEGMDYRAIASDPDWESQKPSVVEGEGELFGADALEQFYALQKLAGQGVGLLSGAGLEPMQAVLEEVEMVGVGGQELVEYRVRFVEERKAKGWS